MLIRNRRKELSKDAEIEIYAIIEDSPYRVHSGSLRIDMSTSPLTTDFSVDGALSLNLVESRADIVVKQKGDKDFTHLLSGVIQEVRQFDNTPGPESLVNYKIMTNFEIVLTSVETFKAALALTA